MFILKQYQELFNFLSCRHSAIWNCNKPWNLFREQLNSAQMRICGMGDSSEVFPTSLLRPILSPGRPTERTDQVESCGFRISGTHSFHFSESHHIVSRRCYLHSFAGDSSFFIVIIIIIFQVSLGIFCYVIEFSALEY